jgi:hypothetical protein
MNPSFSGIWPAPSANWYFDHSFNVDLLVWPIGPRPVLQNVPV